MTKRERSSLIHILVDAQARLDNVVQTNESNQAKFAYTHILINLRYHFAAAICEAYGDNIPNVSFTRIATSINGKSVDTFKVERK